MAGRTIQYPGLTGPVVVPAAVVITTGAYAIANLCRSGGTRSDYYRPIGQVRIAGTVRSTLIDRDSFAIYETMSEQPNTCAFDCFDFTPQRGQEVIVTLGTSANRIFAGHVLAVEQQAPTKDQRVRFRVQCVDYSWLLASRRITGKRYVGESVTNIVRDLMTTYAPSGFTATNVEASMGAVDFTANHAETLMQALTRLMRMAHKATLKGGYVKVDYYKNLSAFVTPDIYNPPAALTMTNTKFWDLRYAIDLSQVRTRTYVLGATTQTTSPVPSGATAVPVSDTTSFEDGAYALAFGNQIAYTGTSPASGPGWLTGVTSFAYAVPQGENVRVMAIAINSNAAASIATIVGSGDGLIDHVIEDERYSATGAMNRAEADVEMFYAPEERIAYLTRDKQAVPSRPLPVSLTVPTTISAQLVVQAVEISQIGHGSNAKFPLKRVEAAKSFRDGFEILAAADQAPKGVA